MADPISPQDLRNAKVDAQTIEDVANGGPAALVRSRLGRTFPTLAKFFADLYARVDQVLQSLAGYNFRGAWAAGTAYAYKDVVTDPANSALQYNAIQPHTSSGNFQADVAAGRWALYRGLTRLDLQDPTIAADIGRQLPGPGAPTQSVEQALRSLEGRYTVNVNAGSFGVSSGNNVNAVNWGRQIWALGDSHGWGQGGPEWDAFVGTVGWSSHSASLYNRGFFGQLEQMLRDKYNFWNPVYTLSGAHTRRVLPGQELSAEALEVDLDPTVRPLRVGAGVVRVFDDSNTFVKPGSSMIGWFTPAAMSGLYPSIREYLESTYKDKLYKGRFDKHLIELRPEGPGEFSDVGRTDFITVWPNTEAGSGPEWTKIQDASGNIVAEYQPGSMLLIRFPNSPLYQSMNMLQDFTQDLYVPGYGPIVVTDRYPFPNGTGFSANIKIRSAGNPEVLVYPTGIERHIHMYMKIFAYDAIKTPYLYLDPVKPFRKTYIGARKISSTKKLRVAFTAGKTGGLDPVPQGALAPTPALANLTEWSWKRTGYPKAGYIDTAGREVEVPGEVTVDEFGVLMDTYIPFDGGQDIVYWIDWGCRVHGRLVLMDGGNASGGTNLGLLLRGVMCDNNEFTNFSMGGHTVAAWNGDAPSFNDAAHDHLGDILAYAKTTVSTLLVEAPIVNEYLAQTPIATFKSGLVQTITRCVAVGNYEGVLQTDVLLFTTMGGRDLEFEGAASAAITYDMYSAAVREVALAQNVGFLDGRQMLKDLVRRGVVDANKLFADNNHPSGFANDLLARLLMDTMQEIMP